MDLSFCFFVSLSDLPSHGVANTLLRSRTPSTRSPRHISYLTFDPRPSLPVLPHRSASPAEKPTLKSRSPKRWDKWVLVPLSSPKS